MLIENELYYKDIKDTASFELPWNKLKNKTVLYTGITGLIGRYFADVVMYKNLNEGLNCTILGVCKEENAIEKVFEKYANNDNFKCITFDISEKIELDENIDFIIHAASNTHPLLYAEYPIETITTNVLGTKNLLELAYNKNSEKFLFISSFEVYGSKTDCDEIKEDDFGTLSTTVLRNCYPESKRLSENLCIAYSSEKNVNSSIVRLSRVFGPTMNYESSLATAQFIKSGIKNTDIVLKSDGEQNYSYNYVADAVTAILTVLLCGEDKEAYNVADKSFNAKLKEFAQICAEINGKEVVFDLPDEVEKKGFSNTTMTILNSEKIKNIGWYTTKNIKERIIDTVSILSED